MLYNKHDIYNLEFQDKQNIFYIQVKLTLRTFMYLKYCMDYRNK